MWHNIYMALPRSESMFWTIAGSAALAAGAVLAVGQFDFLKDSLITHSANAQEMLDQFERSPAGLAVDAVVTKPILEETIFRLVPSILAATIARNNPALALSIGLASSAGFSVYHDIGGDFRLHPEHMSLGQNGFHFAAGLGLWTIAQQRGISHAYAAHMSANATILAFVAAARL